MASKISNICVTSYNSWGFSEPKQDYIKTLQLFSDILCLQEHLLLDAKDKKHSNTNKLVKTLGSQHDMYIVPAFKDNGRVHRGRGSGGLATLWRREHTKYVSKLKCDNHRILPTKFSFPNGHLLLLNCYFPTNPGTDSFDDSELQNVLVEIRRLINEASCLNVLVAGDLNCDFIKNNKFVHIIESFIEEIGLSIFWNNNNNNNIATVDYTHTNINNGVSYFSTIDHFAANPRTVKAVTEANVIHSGSNLSDHSPIYCKINVGQLDAKIEKEVLRKVPSYKRANFDERELFKQSTKHNLSNINIPTCIDCQDIHCSLPDHQENIENYCLEVLQSIEIAAEKKFT